MKVKVLRTTNGLTISITDGESSEKALTKSQVIAEYIKLAQDECDSFEVYEDGFGRLTYKPCGSYWRIKKEHLTKEQTCFIKKVLRVLDYDGFIWKAGAAGNILKGEAVKTVGFNDIFVLE